jgi:hypothetical protein
MTVQELINELEKVENKNLKIIIRGTDPTDYQYNNDVEELGVENVYYEELDGYRRRFVIDGGCF